MSLLIGTERFHSLQNGCTSDTQHCGTQQFSLSKLHRATGSLLPVDMYTVPHSGASRVGTLSCPMTTVNLSCLVCGSKYIDVNF